jgi:hypothetical protein
MYLNFILTVLCLILLAFLVSGVLLFKKIMKYIRNNRNPGGQPNFGDAMGFLQGMQNIKNMMNNHKK